MGHPDPAAETADRAEELLEETWSQRNRSVRGRELRVELMVSAVFFAALAALLAFAPDAGSPHAAAGALVVAYAIAARIEFPVGAGIVVPTEIFLIPMFVVAPAQLVPGMVFAGLLLGALGSAALGRTDLDRIVYCAGDAFHALGPALVLVVFADGTLTGADAPTLLLAFAAQFAFDLTSSAFSSLVLRIRAGVQLRVMAQVWLVDGALAPFGLLAAAVASDHPWAALAPLPVLGLLVVMARDRRHRIARAHDRLVALEHERLRLRGAIERVGDAFASSLDIDALLEIVTRAAMEALDAEAARANFPHAERASRQLGLLDSDEVRSALVAAAGDDGPVVERAGVHALAGRIGPDGYPIAVVSVARRREFSDDERQTFDHLCEQATVSAANAVRHEQLQAGEARLRAQAFKDPLTGLANRARFAQFLEEAEARVARDAREVAVLFIDLDGFKVVNDTLGHEAGDEVLVAIADRLRQLVRDADVAARIGGDEFAVLLNELTGMGQAHAVAVRLVDHLSAAIRTRGTEFVVRASVGLAPVAAGLSHEEILNRADLAMYAAKRQGGNRVAVFNSDMLAHSETRAELAQDLRGAAERDELELHFQPVIDLAAGTIPMVEALVRWEHPTRGPLTPADFITLAEETACIDALGHFVLDEACRAVASWTALDPYVSVSVNVSAAQFRDGRFADSVTTAIARHSLTPDRLVLEVTESVLVEPDPRPLPTSRRCARRGSRSRSTTSGPATRR